MHILQAFCALAIASLCTDVEAMWYILAGRGYRYRFYTNRKRSDEVMKFDEDLRERKYTGTETLYFKVTSDSSPVTINNIKVDGFKGRLLLSARAANKYFCVDQTSECNGTKQIRQKDFFIYVRPNPEFTGGQLTLDMEQAGYIYQINHEGARLWKNEAVGVFSGYHTVNYNERLPQYKITCDGNCNITQITGKGYNYNIGVSKSFVDVGSGGRCQNCYCTTTRNGPLTDCKKDGSTQLNIGTSSFYVTLFPQGKNKVEDVEAYIYVPNFSSVTRIGRSGPLLCYDGSTLVECPKDRSQCILNYNGNNKRTTKSCAKSVIKDWGWWSFYTSYHCYCNLKGCNKSKTVCRAALEELNRQGK